MTNQTFNPATLLASNKPLTDDQFDGARSFARMSGEQLTAYVDLIIRDGMHYVTTAGDVRRLQFGLNFIRTARADKYALLKTVIKETGFLTVKGGRDEENIVSVVKTPAAYMRRADFAESFDFAAHELFSVYAEKVAQFEQLAKDEAKAERDAATFQVADKLESFFKRLSTLAADGKLEGADAAIVKVLETQALRTIELWREGKLDQASLIKAPGETVMRAAFESAQAQGTA